jgi:hypothetical protein
LIPATVGLETERWADYADVREQVWVAKN